MIVMVIVMVANQSFQPIWWVTFNSTPDLRGAYHYYYYYVLCCRTGNKTSVVANGKMNEWPIAFENARKHAADAATSDVHQAL